MSCKIVTKLKMFHRLRRFSVLWKSSHRRESGILLRRVTKVGIRGLLAHQFPWQQCAPEALKFGYERGSMHGSYVYSFPGTHPGPSLLDVS